MLAGRRNRNGLPGVDKKNHVVKIPHFGTIAFAELVFMPGIKDVDDDAFRAGLARWGNGGRSGSCAERATISATAQVISSVSSSLLLVIFLVVMLVGGCQGTPPLSAVYDRIDQKIQHGELDAALQDMSGRVPAPRPQGPRGHGAFVFSKRTFLFTVQSTRRRSRF